MASVKSNFSSPYSERVRKRRKFAYLGRKYRLKVYKSEEVTKPTLMFKQGKFIATVPPHITEKKESHFPTSIQTLVHFTRRNKTTRTVKRVLP